MQVVATNQNDIMRQLMQNEELHKEYEKRIEEFKQFVGEDHTGHDHADGEHDDSKDCYIRDHKKMLRKQCIVRNYEPLRIKWDLFIILLAIFNSVCIPINLAFHPPSMNTYLYKAVNQIVDVCFWFDILLTFRTTFKHPRTGDEITNPREIAKNYCSGTFLIDLISAINFAQVGMLVYPVAKEKHKVEKMFDGLVQTMVGKEPVHAVEMDAYEFISCLKLIRVLRLGKLISYLNESDEFKLQLRLFKLIFFFLLYCHISACLWYIVNRYNDKEWIPL